VILLHFGSGPGSLMLENDTKFVTNREKQTDSALLNRGGCFIKKWMKTDKRKKYKTTFT
jgi:hypothetical protein